MHANYDVLFQVGSGIREEAIAKRAAQIARDEAAKDFEKLLAGMEAKYTAALKGRICVEFGTDSGGQHGSAPGPAVGAGSADLVKVQEIFNAYCISCHKGTAAKKGVDLTDVTRLSTERLRQCAQLVHLNIMPPEGDAVPVGAVEFLNEFTARLPIGGAK